MKKPGEYLAISEEYGRWLGGLRWAENGEAVEFVSEDPEVGLTFAMAREIAVFLRGFHNVRNPVPFAYVLHIMWLLGAGSASSAPPIVFSRRRRRLSAAFHETGRPLFNAGALLGRLCRDVPREVDPPDVAHLDAFLRWWPVSPDDPPPGPSIEVPSLEPGEFQDRLFRALDGLSDEELQHWLRHGRGPVSEESEQVAHETIAARVPDFAELLESVAQRPRLARSAPLVEHLAGALELPARRQLESALPVGGYADVATRGHPEQILPSQFALDGLEFLRRFAARELLYFQREQPRAATEEVVVILVDQGVRTWGDVRLFLAAAAMALAKQLTKKGVSVQLATTGSCGQVTPLLRASAETLGNMLESSDLCLNPAVALETVLEQTDHRLRDVVLLTHPRNLHEEDVVAAARTITAGTRLFAVAVEGSGEVELLEIRHGVAIGLSRCRVTLSEPQQARVQNAAPGSWQGDVEPIGFPFRMGVLSVLDERHFDFDYTGERLLASASASGLLHVWRIDSDECEVLPRPMLDGKPLTQVEAIVGVAGGFVVGFQYFDSLAAAHYNLEERTCTVHRLGPPPRPKPAHKLHDWLYHRALHAVIVRSTVDRAMAHAIDLGADKNFACFRQHDPEAPVAKRAKIAASQAAFQPPASLPVIAESQTRRHDEFGIVLDAKIGIVEAHTHARTWTGIVPMYNGRRALRKGRIRAARAGENTLAFVADTAQAHLSLYVYRASGQTGHECVAEYLVSPKVNSFALSTDGRRIAQKLSQFRIEVREIGELGPPKLVTTRTKCHSRLDVGLGDSCLVIRTGKFSHIIRWDGSELTIAGTQDYHEAQMRTRGLISSESTRFGAQTTYDTRRFHSGCRTTRLTALVDLYSHVVLTNSTGVLVAMFFAFRNDVAVWLPDGTKWGPVALIGGPPTPNATSRIAAALRAAVSQ